MMETNLYKDRGNWLPQQNWDYLRNNSFDQQGSLMSQTSNIANSWRYKPRITPEVPNQKWSTGFQRPLDNTLPFNRNLPWFAGKDLNQWSPIVQSDWNHRPILLKNPPIQRRDEWLYGGNKEPWSAIGNKGARYPTVDKQLWAPKQQLKASSNGFKPHWFPDNSSQDHKPQPKYRRVSESNQGMMLSTFHPGEDYSRLKPSWRGHRYERESKKGYESRHRHPDFKSEKKRHPNEWAREAAKALKEEKPSKFKLQEPSTISGPRVEVEYCKKKCRASKLHEACSTGDLEKVNDVLNQPTVELEERDDIFWETPLMWATCLGKEEIVMAVLDKGASPWVASKEGATLLHLAVLSRNLDMVKYIKETTQIDIDHQDKSGKTALMLAAQLGMLEMVRYLIEEGANAELRSKKKANILLLAAESGNTKLVEYILDKTQLAHNINCINKDEHTPLMLAASAGFVEICQLLIKHGANYNIVDSEGRTPLHAAVEKGYSEVVDCLLEQKKIRHIQDRSGKTPVQLAMRHKHIPIALNLLENGASMDIPDRKGRTVLHMAAESGHMEIFHYLQKCKRKGDYQARTKQCWYTPTHCGAKAGHLDVVQWFIQEGVDPNITDRDLNTPLHAAALEGHLDVVKLLIGAQANIDQRNKGGETPLHLAAMWNHLSVVQYLCENGADVNVNDKWSQTALQVAQKGNCSDCTKYLEQKQTSQEAPE